MPLQVIVTEGLLSPEAEQSVFRDLTHLLLELHGISDNAFMTPNIIGEVVVVEKGRSFSGGAPADIAVFELKAPSFVLADPTLQSAWIARGTQIIEKAAQGRIPRNRIYGNVVHALDGAWGIAGVAYSNDALGEALTTGVPI